MVNYNKKLLIIYYKDCLNQEIKKYSDFFIRNGFEIYFNVFYFFYCFSSDRAENIKVNYFSYFLID